MKRQSILVLAIVMLTWCTRSQATIVMDWVTVGNPGNESDGTGYGAVNYIYRIGKYEVTHEQYIEFLNAVAATDTYGLYNTNMAGDWQRGGIDRSGSEGSYTYSIKNNDPNLLNRPANWVNWYDALRFCNWLHNGQPTGDQTDATTEDGAYDMDGDPNLRKPGATVWLPSEDEWYKAAYHKNDGVTENYFDYPICSDSEPSNHLIDPDPGNNATFWDHKELHSTIGPPYFFTEVGAHENSDSPYGAFDMGGNVYEWNEAIMEWDERYRGIRGGSVGSIVFSLRGANRASASAILDDLHFGFRVASVPCDYVISGDLNDDCKVNFLDVQRFVNSCWLTVGPEGNLYVDSWVDFRDFALMANNWLINCGVTPDDPACIPK